MCLSRVDKKIKHTRRVNGYKVMRLKGNGSLRSMYYGDEVMVVGGTYTDRKRLPLSTSYLNTKYSPGYHIYLAERDAVVSSSFTNPVVKVRFSKVVASGKQFDEPIVVARRITILKVLTGQDQA